MVWRPARKITISVPMLRQAAMAISDGIAQVEGLPGVMANELLQFEDGTLGLALNLELRHIGVVVLGPFEGIEEGQEVRRTGEIGRVEVTKMESKGKQNRRIHIVLVEEDK